jgi:predicted  nucleic acid-binding Zn-ribbon protein
MKRRPIQPKLRAMPSRKSLSAVYMQMHQLANEKERLQQEMAMISDRQRQINARLREIERDLAIIEAQAGDMNNPFQIGDSPLALPTKTVPSFSSRFQTMTIDY